MNAKKKDPISVTKWRIHIFEFISGRQTVSEAYVDRRMREFTTKSRISNVMNVRMNPNNTFFFMASSCSVLDKR
jgi:hypothetical protein